MQKNKHDELIAVCQELVQMNTANPPGSELNAALYCKKILDDVDFETQLVDHGNGRASLLAILEGKPDGETFLFVGHLDTVPPGDSDAWERDPTSGFCDGEKIHGRGTSDMKGGLAVLLQAAKVLKGKKPHNSIIFALTADEESGCMGAEALIQMPDIKKAKFVMIPEPTANQIGIAEKGALWMKIISKGRAAHGSMPDLGVNAISGMVDLVNRLDFSAFSQEHDYLGKFTSSLNTISGGIKTNIIPDHCEITLDIRTLPSQSHDEIIGSVENVIRKINDKNDRYRYELETVINKPGIETDPEQSLAAEIIELVHQQLTESRLIGLNYYTDGAVLIPALNVPFIIFGPGDPGQAHCPNETIDVAKLVCSCEIYAEILKKQAFE